MARNFFNYINYSYSGGMNDADEIDQLRDEEAVLIQNAYVSSIGALEKRAGMTAVGDDTGSTAITGLTGWREDDGTKWILSTTGTNLRYLNSTTWDTMDSGFTTGLDTEYVIANNKMYIFNGTDNTHSWDGASVVLNSGLVDLGSTTVPKAKYGMWWKNYMFMAGESDLNGTTYPSRVWFSNIGDADTWTTGTDYFDVGLSDGQEITGIGLLGEYLVVFKRKSIYVLTGSGPADWRLSGTVNNLVNVENSVGCVSHRSIVQIGNDLWFMSDDGIRSLRRNEEGGSPLTGIVSGNIQGTIDSLNPSALDKICATLYDKRVYYAMPTGSSTYNNIVMVADTRITLDKPYNPFPWTKYTGWQPAVFAVHRPSSQLTLYFGNGSADSKVFIGETGSTDVAAVGTLANSGKIDFDYRSKMIDLRQPEMDKTFRFMKVGVQSGGDYDVTVYTSVDGQVYTNRGVINLSSGDLWNTGVWDTATWGYQGEIKKKFSTIRASEQIQVRFENDAAGEDVKMYPYTLAIKTKKVK
jgi:hypothetical protein